MNFKNDGLGSCPPSCESGWTGFSDGAASRYCAKYVSFNVTYDEALAKCQALGATLPTVRSEPENEFFLSKSYTFRPITISVLLEFGRLMLT